MQAEVPLSTLRHFASLRESPSGKANVREDRRSLGTAIPYRGQPLQLGQNAAVVLGPQKVLTKMLNFRRSFRSVKHLFAT